MPSGLLTVALRSFTYTSDHFQIENTYVKIELLSTVDREKVQGGYNSQEQMQLIRECLTSEYLNMYRQEIPGKATSSRKTKVVLNETNIFLLRHYSDQLAISLYQKPKAKTADQS
jgi:hypothetical protein